MIQAGKPGYYPGDKPGGIGKKDKCPGNDAYQWILKYLKEHPNCAAAAKRVCNNALPPFTAWNYVTNSKCDTANPKTPGCTRMGRLPDGSCTAFNICFSDAACKKDVKHRACLLLLENLNGCNCIYNKFNGGEGPTDAVLKTCGLDKICGGKGVHPPKTQ
jgi:hypothetical protein